METDEIIALKCHRCATEEEMSLADMLKKRPTSGRGAHFFQESTARSSTASPATVKIQTPTNPCPLGSVQTRGSNDARVSRVDVDTVTPHCTS